MGRISPAERDAILLDYECAYISANGFDPDLRLLSDGNYLIGDIDTPDARFAIYEFPPMARTLWARAEQQYYEERTESLRSLIKRLMPVRFADMQKTQL